MNCYLTVYDTCENTIEIKKSQFITKLIHVESEDEVNLYLEEIKKQHYKANHNCYAYIIGENKNSKKASDDGEPSGTAGKPILSVLENSELTNVLGVVTRYFGGIKLGASGLCRAYSQSMSDCVKKSNIIKRVYCSEVKFEAEYSFYSKLEGYLMQNNYVISDKQFTNNTQIKVFIPLDEVNKVKEDIIQLSLGQCNGEILSDKYISISEE